MRNPFKKPEPSPRYSAVTHVQELAEKGNRFLFVVDVDGHGRIRWKQFGVRLTSEIQEQQADVVADGIRQMVKKNEMEV